MLYIMYGNIMLFRVLAQPYFTEKLRLRVTGLDPYGD